MNFFCTNYYTTELLRGPKRRSYFGRITQSRILKSRIREDRKPNRISKMPNLKRPSSFSRIRKGRNPKRSNIKNTDLEKLKKPNFFGRMTQKTNPKKRSYFGQKTKGPNTKLKKSRRLDTQKVEFQKGRMSKRPNIERAEYQCVITKRQSSFGRITTLSMNIRMPKSRMPNPKRPHMEKDEYQSRPNPKRRRSFDQITH